MKKDMILHTRNEEQCALGRTRVRLKAYCSAPWGVLHVFLLLLMMTVGVNGAWGQEPVTITTDVNNKVLYLIQSFSNDAFYIRNDTKNGTKLNTSNIVTTNSEFYFLNADIIDDTQYYYIVHNGTGKYVYVASAASGQALIYGNAPAADATDTAKDLYRFKITKNDSRDAYNIIAKGSNLSLFKKNGNSDGAVIELNSADDDKSCWNFIAKTNYSKPAVPFSLSSLNGAKHKYYIQNNKYDTFYLISGTSYVTTNTKTDDNKADMMWYFVKAPASETDPYMNYYYIIHAQTGKYLRYTKANNTENSDQAVELSDYNSSEDDRFLYIIVRGSISGEASTTYCIAPYLPRVQRVENTISLCRRLKGDGGNETFTYAGVFKERGNNNFTHWNFSFAGKTCANPAISCDLDGNIIMTSNEDETIYYTTDGSDPQTSGTAVEYNADSWPSSTQRLIKAFAKLKNDNTGESNSSVITLLNKPDVTLEAGPYTYKAADWEPSVTLSVGTTQTTTGFSTTYANQKNAGTANVTITDNEASDAWYIWNVPVTEFTIDKAPLTIKANDRTIGYGDEPDNDGVTYNGFVGDPAETESVLGGTLSYSYKTSGDDPQPYTPFDAQYGNQGSYVITPSGLTSTNYDITFSTGVLTVAKKSIGDGALAEGFTLSFDEDGNVILEFGIHTLNKDVDYAIGNEVVGTKYSTRTLSGAGNYDGSVDIRNAIVHFTTDANQTEWSATFVAEKSGANDIGHALPDGMKAFIITDIEGEWAIPEQLNYIPEGVPVLLVTNKETNGFIVKDASVDTPIPDDQKDANKLKEVTGETASFATRQIYVLYKNEFVLNLAGNLGVGKVYMENPTYTPSGGGGAPSRLRIKWGEDTGIKDLQNNGTVDRKNDLWYTIDGQRLSGQPSKRGLYIVDGKKVMVK